MSDKSGKELERRVAETYEALGYRVTPNTQVAGRQTDLLAKKDIAGAADITLAIECKDHSRPIGSPAVDAFSSRVVAQCTAGQITAGVLVSRNGFTSDALAAAEVQKQVTLLSLEQLTSQIFDVRHALRELIERYEAEPIFHDYLPLKVEVQDWSRQAKDAETKEFAPLMEQMIGFDGKDGIGAMIVLADFGAGKTTLLRNIEYHRAKAHLDGEDTRIPLFVQLRDFGDTQDASSLLRASFHDAYYRDIPLGSLWQRIESGNFYLLLDGFDEMVDRSDAARRLELFHTLLPLLRSHSPVVLTSRPSYLVEQGELDALVAELSSERPRPPRVIKGGSYSKVVAERLRRKLSEDIQETDRRPRGQETLDARQVRVLRLRKLDWTQVEEFVALHSDALADTDVSAPEVLAFIERTYDLTDLATRPMLLRLIVSTVVLGGIDLGDTSRHYGASGLYEMYTHAKLEVDIEKLRGKSGGLDVDTRRELAEALALEMFATKSLEVDFHSTLERLAKEDPSLRSALARSGLSPAEIATDIAARSFVTLDRNGTCRFIHKSFRGFFVARVLKEALPEINPVFEEALEQEVLYFLGGFDPTEPRIGETLWKAYRKAPSTAPVLRRNLLTAFLYTRPDHDGRAIGDVELFEADFGHLEFNDVRMSDVTWRDISIRRLDLVKTIWQSVQLVDVRLTSLLAEGGRLDFSLKDCALDSWACEGAMASVGVADSVVEKLEIERATFDCRIDRELIVKELLVDHGAAVIHGRGEITSLIASARVSGGFLSLSGVKVDELEAVDSVLSFANERTLPAKSVVQKSLLVLSRGFARKSNSARRLGMRIDRGSVVLGPYGVPQLLLTFPAGVFGVVRPGPAEHPLPVSPKAWGVLDAQDLMEKLGVPRSSQACRLNRLLLVNRKLYGKLRSGDLSAIADLESLHANAKGAFAESGSIDRLAELRREAKAQFEAILNDGEWEDFGKFLPRRRGR
jgi:restriction endonuclease/NACHT domain-containing protein